MKITLKQLKTVINEEVSRLENNVSLNEDIEGSVPSGARMELTKNIHAAIELCDELGRTEQGGKRFKECEKHLLAAWKAAKGGPRI